MNITLNGESIKTRKGITLSGLLEEKSRVHKKRTAVLLNGDIIHTGKTGQIILQENDTVEIITLAAGG